MNGRGWRRVAANAASRYGAAAAIAAVALVIQIAPAWVGYGLRYQRADLLHGELWRALTAHLVHAGWAHLLPDLAGLFIICSLPATPEAFAPRRLLPALAWIGIFISGGLLLWDPNLRWYVGLSGVLHGLLVMLLPRLWRENTLVGALLTVGVTAKLIAEQATGASLGTEALVGVPVVIDAHLLGALGAVPLALWEIVRQRDGRQAPRGPYDEHTRHL